ncbi:hypothetical protein PoB_007035600 [Plakobranchus ocellatus]|uniref:Uncharacterized protein n=1 Tax=Plakobranchus ocellatus TaxID=259542 RepID=A0AAV4DI66_9GAST|nr:hypothetical protein PoB_007035600 [Plakobranchus ocellatus]
MDASTPTLGLDDGKENNISTKTAWIISDESVSVDASTPTLGLDNGKESSIGLKTARIISVSVDTSISTSGRYNHTREQSEATLLVYWKNGLTSPHPCLVETTHCGERISEYITNMH